MPRDGQAADVEQLALSLKSTTDEDLVVVHYAGGGGSCEGIEQALNDIPDALRGRLEPHLLHRPVDIAINHDPEAIAMHAANHPRTQHYIENCFAVDPIEATAGRRIGLMWLSPDCRHHSKAKGGALLDRRIRGLAWVGVKWAGQLARVGRAPRIIMLENVEEFVGWGPLVARRDKATGRALRRDGSVAPAGQPTPLPDQHHTADRRRKGRTFRRFVAALRGLGYQVEWRELRACDYGAPTIRKRLFLVARCDGEPIVWPAPTHGPGRAKPYRVAAEIIEWSLPCPSIFAPGRDLAEATMARIAAGFKRYVVDAKEPFIVTLNHAGGFRGQSLGDPAMTLTAARDAHAIVAPYLIPRYGERNGQEPRARSVKKPMATVVNTANGDTLAAVYMTKFQQNSFGQPVDEPVDTVMAGAARFGVVAAHMLRHNGSSTAGSPMTAPTPTATQRSTQIQLAEHHLVRCGQVAAFLAQHNVGTVGHDRRDPVSTIVGKGCTQQGDPRKPANTVTAAGQHLALVFAFLVKYYGATEDGQSLKAPLHTVTVRDRYGLIQAAALDLGGAFYLIADIGMRMLTPRELFRAQGFPERYQIAPVVNGKPLTKTAQIRMCGNSVSPPLARALVQANYRPCPAWQQRSAAA